MKRIIAAVVTLILMASAAVIIFRINGDAGPNKISAELQTHLDQKEKEIQVNIWFEDIDLDAVHAEAERVLGYTEDDIQKAEDAIPSFRRDINETDPDYERLYLAYIEQTRAQRAAVLEMMNHYIETQRRMEREAYEAYNKENLSKLRIDESAVLYCGQLSPDVIAVLSEKEILRLNRNPLVCALDYHDPNPPTTQPVELYPEIIG